MPSRVPFGPYVGLLRTHQEGIFLIDALQGHLGLLANLRLHLCTSNFLVRRVGGIEAVHFDKEWLVTAPVILKADAFCKP